MARILLADDQELIRHTLQTVLSSTHNLPVIAAASTGNEALRAMRDANGSPPDTLITETILPDMPATELASQLHAVSPNLRIIALTSRSDHHSISAALKANFAGYVLKSCPFHRLLDAIQVVHSGQIYLCPEVATTVISSHVHNNPASAAKSESGNISEREREVLHWVADGLSTKQIADRLTISLKTVETHRRRVMSKLKLFSVAELTKYAIRTGISSL